MTAKAHNLNAFWLTCYCQHHFFAFDTQTGYFMSALTLIQTENFMCRYWDKSRHSAYVCTPWKRLCFGAPTWNKPCRRPWFQVHLVPAPVRRAEPAPVWRWGNARKISTQDTSKSFWVFHRRLTSAFSNFRGWVFSPPLRSPVGAHALCKKTKHVKPKCFFFLSKSFYKPFYNLQV